MFKFDTLVGHLCEEIFTFEKNNHTYSVNNIKLFFKDFHLVTTVTFCIDFDIMKKKLQ